MTINTGNLSGLGDAKFAESGASQRFWLIGIIASGPCAGNIADPYEAAAYCIERADAILLKLTREGNEVGSWTSRVAERYASFEPDPEPNP